MVLPRSEFQNGVSSTQKDARQTVTEILALIQKQFENGGIVYFWYELAQDKNTSNNESIIL